MNKTNGSKKWRFQAYLGTNPITGERVKTTRRGRGFDTKREAQVVLSQLKYEFEEANRDLRPKQEMITFAELYDLWLIQHRLRVKQSTVGISSVLSKVMFSSTSDTLNWIRLLFVTVRKS